MSKQTPKQPPAAQAPARPAGAAPRAEGTHKHLIDDDVLHVPKGVSRGTFIFLVGLLIFLMVIWLVPDSIFGITAGPRNPIAVRFRLPSGGTVEWKGSDIFVAQDTLRRVIGLDYFLAPQLQIDARNPSPEQLVRVLILDRIAQDAGVEVTDDDLASYLRRSLEFVRDTPDGFKSRVRASGLSQVAVENTMRAMLRTSRFLQLVGYSGAVPDPAEIEKQWNRDNVEFAFDFVTVPVEDMKEEARKELPDEAGLKAWFEALDEGEKTQFQTEEKRKAEVVTFRDVETTPAAELLAAYPEKPPEGAEPTPPAELASQYYNRVFPRRFAKPAEEGAEDGTPLFFTFAEVEAQAAAEAPVYFALQRWIEDLNARRMNGEEIDLAAEAQRLGLAHRAFTEPMTREQLAAEDAAGDDEIAGAIFATSPDGSFHASPMAMPDGLAVVRANERVEPELPPFESVRDQVAEKWIEPRARELSEKRLAALREGFERFEPPPREEEPDMFRPPRKKGDHHRATSEAFRAAAEAAGLEVKARDYLNKSGPQKQDLFAGDEERRTLSQQASSFGLYDLESDEVAAPGASFDGETVYLVRLAGKRDVPIDDMSPTQYDRYKQGARQSAVYEVGRSLDLDFLRREFGLWLADDEAKAAAAAEQGEKKAEKKTE